MAMGLTTPLDERDGIPLATVHSAKGLEYDVVFLIGMTEGTFPDYRAVRQGGKVLEEEKNEAYVAITRARRLLYITYPQNRVMPWDRENHACTKQQPSRFLANLEYYELNHAGDSEKRMVADADPTGTHVGRYMSLGKQPG
jgi:DNA helicase II / ATP-dependent DNA helicase PcrA